MTDNGTAILRCEDGTEIPFDWVYPEAPQFEWLRDKAHWPDPASPMEIWLRGKSWAGVDRAWAEVGMEPLPMFRRFQLAGPFLYVRMNPLSPEEMMAMAVSYREKARAFGNAQGFWRDYCEPRIQAVVAELSRLDENASPTTIGEALGYGFHQTFTSLVLLIEASMRLTMLLGASVGADAGLMAFEVTQGGSNASQAIDREIWDLAALARRTPAVADMLRSEASDEALAALRARPEAGEFLEAFDALLVRHGSRSGGWTFTLPTWRERPDMPLSLVRAQLDAEAIGHEELEARSAAARREATEKALAGLPEDKHAEFHAVVAELDGYVSVREGRAYWQMILTGEIRNALLRVGADHVRRGRIDQADDILFLLPEDFEGNGATDLRPLAAKRRAAWERAHDLVPPSVIGTPGDVSAMAQAAPPPTATELHGAPASRGVVTGVARIIQRPEDSATLKPGEVLVCVMTTPAWTPLFAIAGGIITETGGALSHPAITAREYGIPAVVAVMNATKLIRDGQTVTLDGGKGIVTLSP